MRLGLGIGLGRLQRSSIDPAAAAYFAATGITGATEKAAINTLVRSLKSAGLWSKMKAVYPFVTDNRNLLSYTEDFGNAYWNKYSSTITANATTAPNGTLTADLFYASAAGNPKYVQLNSPVTISAGSVTQSIYAKYNGIPYLYMDLYEGADYFVWFNIQNGTVGTIQSGSGITASIQNVGNGWYRCIATRTFSGTQNYASFRMSDTDNSIVATQSGTNGIYLWGAQLELGSTATTYQPIATTQQSFISNQFKYNLVNPVDSDSAFRGVFNGGWTFSNQGATPNGTNGYMDTKFVPSSNLTINDQSYSVYSRTDTAAGSKREMGLSYLGEVSVLAKYSGNLFYPIIGDSIYPSVSNTDSRGHYISNRTNSSNIKGHKNGSLVLDTVQPAAIPTTYSVYIGCRNSAGAAGEYSDRQLAFSHLGQGLTNTEATALYNAVQTMNTTLSRNV